jgi:hypothetical protein
LTGLMQSVPLKGRQFHPLQLTIGPTGSGAPPHFHADAVNALIRGRKRWLLWPPHKSFMSKMHPPTHIAAGPGAGNRTGSADTNGAAATTDFAAAATAH